MDTSIIMKKKIIHTIWIIYALLWVIIFVIVIFLCVSPIYICSKKKAFRFHHRMAKYYTPILLSLIGIRITVIGKRHIYPLPSIFISNHISFIDGSILYGLLPLHVKILAKKKYATIPLIGWVYQLRSILIDLQSQASKLQAFKEMKECLCENTSLLIFPEGTRNKGTDILNFFYDGAFKLAFTHHSPIVPICLVYKKATREAKLYNRLIKYQVSICFLSPMYYNHHDIGDFKKEVFLRMHLFIKEHL